MPQHSAKRRPALVTPHWRAGLIGVFLAVLAYRGLQLLAAAALARYGTVVASPLSHTVLARVGPLAVSYGVAAWSVWAVGVGGMLVTVAACAHELAIACVHPAGLEKRAIAFIVAGTVGTYCGRWLYQALALTVTHQLALLPRP